MIMKSSSYLGKEGNTAQLFGKSEATQQPERNTKNKAEHRAQWKIWCSHKRYLISAYN